MMRPAASAMARVRPPRSLGFTVATAAAHYSCSHATVHRSLHALPLHLSRYDDVHHARRMVRSRPFPALHRQRRHGSSTASPALTAAPPTQEGEEQRRERLAGSTVAGDGTTGAGEGKECAHGHVAGIPGVRFAERRMAVVYTCKVCDTRSAKAFSKEAYDHGVVIVKCPGCANMHLIADRLGYFYDEKWDVQEFLREMGDRVVAVDDDNVLQLTPTDMLGSSSREGGGEGEINVVRAHDGAAQGVSAGSEADSTHESQVDPCVNGATGDGDGHRRTQ